MDGSIAGDLLDAFPYRKRRLDVSAASSGGTLSVRQQGAVFAPTVSGRSRHTFPAFSVSVFFAAGRNHMLIKAPHKLGGGGAKQEGAQKHPYDNYRTVERRASIVRSEQL